MLTFLVTSGLAVGLYFLNQHLQKRDLTERFATYDNLCQEDGVQFLRPLYGLPLETEEALSSEELKMFLTAAPNSIDSLESEQSNLRKQQMKLQQAGEVPASIKGIYEVLEQSLQIQISYNQYLAFMLAATESSDTPTQDIVFQQAVEASGIYFVYLHEMTILLKHLSPEVAEHLPHCLPDGFKLHLRSFENYVKRYQDFSHRG